MPRIDFTLLYDHPPGVTGMGARWGFSALVRTPDARILFDTGSDAPSTLRYLAALGLEASQLDLLMISHAGWEDHGLLDTLLAAKPELAVAAPKALPVPLIRELQGRCPGLILVRSEPRELIPGVHSTGSIGIESAEQALALDTGSGGAVVGGCTLVGMERFVTRAATYLREPVHWTAGGFWSRGADARAIARSISALKGLGVESVIVTHCAGPLAVEELRRVFGGAFAEAEVGHVMSLDAGARRPYGARP